MEWDRDKIVHPILTPQYVSATYEEMASTELESLRKEVAELRQLLSVILGLCKEYSK